MLTQPQSSIANERRASIAFMSTTLAMRIRKAREQAGMTQADLARNVSSLSTETRVTRSAVSQWESGDVKDLRVANLFAVAKVTGADIYWLGLGGREPPEARAWSTFCKLKPEAREAVVRLIEALAAMETGKDPTAADSTPARR
jgi:transcriptional regulator with XRE-family HTH domain